VFRSRSANKKSTSNTEEFRRTETRSRLSRISCECQNVGFALGILRIYVGDKSLPRQPFQNACVMVAQSISLRLASVNNNFKQTPRDISEEMIPTEWYVKLCIPMRPQLFCFFFLEIRYSTATLKFLPRRILPPRNPSCKLVAETAS